MSRLDDFITRVTAQKAVLEQVSDLIEAVDGPVLVVGLGNGRIYDHIRETMPGREIFAFDRSVRAHPSDVPDGTHMIVGEYTDTLAFCHQRTGRAAALVHCALGTGDPTADLAVAAWAGPLLARLIGAGGYLVCDVPVDHQQLEQVPALPSGQGSGQTMFRKRQGNCAP